MAFPGLVMAFGYREFAEASNKKNRDIISDSNLFSIFALRFKNQKFQAMARMCEITGKTMMIGHNVSHSNIKTKRRFNVNLQNKRFFIPEENKWSRF